MLTEQHFQQPETLLYPMLDFSVTVIVRPIALLIHIVQSK